MTRDSTKILLIQGLSSPPAELSTLRDRRWQAEVEDFHMID